MQIEPRVSRDLVELLRLGRRAFAAKVRMARAVLGLSQSEFGSRVGLTQRAIHKLEQGETEPRRATVHAIEEFWRTESIEFEDMPDGGFRVMVRSAVFDHASSSADAARRQLGVTAVAYQG